MATTGLQRLVRRAVLQRLAVDPFVTALVPATSIHAQDAGPTPAWPFIKTGPSRSEPRRATGTDGALVSLDVHAFARPLESAGRTVQTGEDHCSEIGAAIETALARAWVDLEDGSQARIELSDMQLLQDPEPGAFHYVAQVNARVLAATGV